MDHVIKQPSTLVMFFHRQVVDDGPAQMTSEWRGRGRFHGMKNRTQKKNTKGGPQKNQL